MGLGVDVRPGRSLTYVDNHISPLHGCVMEGQVRHSVTLSNRLIQVLLALTIWRSGCRTDLTTSYRSRLRPEAFLLGIPKVPT